LTRSAQPARVFPPRLPTASIRSPSHAASKAGFRRSGPIAHDLIAKDGKTSRRTHDGRKGLKALRTLSAYATNPRPTLAQLSVPDKTNQITAIPDRLDRLAESGKLAGALVALERVLAA